MTTKKSKSKKSSKKPAFKRRIPRQDALPGMGDAKIAAIENAALTYAEIRDQRQALTAEESSLKQELIALMHKEGKTTYKRGNIQVNLTVEKEKIKVKVAKEDDISVDASGAGEDPEVE